MLHRYKESTLQSRSWLVAIVLLLSLTPLQARPVRSFLVSGRVRTAQRWTARSLRNVFSADVHNVTFLLKEHLGSAHVIPLLSVIMAGSPRLDRHRKHPELGFVAMVQGRDGYIASFSMGELRLAGPANSVWLALDWNGAPLKADKAPVRLIVQKDDKPSRWVHGVARIILVDTGLLVSHPLRSHHHPGRL